MRLSSAWKFRLLVLYLLLHVFDFNPLFVDIKPQMRIQAHVLVGHPHQSEASDQVPAPVVKEQFVARQSHKKDGDVVAEAVLTRENKKAFSENEV